MKLEVEQGSMMHVLCSKDANSSAKEILQCVNSTIQCFSLFFAVAAEHNHVRERYILLYILPLYWTGIARVQLLIALVL